MKFSMQATDFADMVSVCSLAISARPLRPVNECVYLQARMDEGIPMLVMIGKDAGAAIQKVSDRATVEEDGEALIPAKTLLSYLKLMDGDVLLTVDGKNQATLKSKGKKVNISCMDGAEFEPGMTRMENPNEVNMDGAVFGALTNSVSHCVGNDQGRMVLTGINFVFDGTKVKNGAETCGLDGYRMAICRGNVETNGQFTALIPGTSAALVKKVIGDSEGVSFRFGNGVMIAEAYDTAIEVSLLAGEYMDYKKLSDRNGTMRMKANVDALLNAVRTAMISASEAKKNLIVLKVQDEDTVQVSAMNDKSAALVNVNCLVEGSLSDGKNEIAFNGKYLEDALKAQSVWGEEAILTFDTSVAPMTMVPDGRDDYFQLVLPVRRTNG